MRIAAVLFTCGLALATYSLKASSNVSLPHGWSIGGEAPKLYDADIDSSDSPSGKASMVLSRTESSHPFGSAHLAQSIPAETYAGKRVKVSIRARFQSSEPKMNGLIYTSSDDGTETSGMSARTTGVQVNGDWLLFQHVMTFPANLKKLAIGVGLNGAGSAKVDSIDLEVLGDSPPNQRGTNTQGLTITSGKGDDKGSR